VQFYFHAPWISCCNSKKCLKSVYICKRYRKMKSGGPFFGPPGIIPSVDVEGVGCAGVLIVVYQGSDNHGEDLQIS